LRAQQGLRVLRVQGLRVPQGLQGLQVLPVPPAVLPVRRMRQ
jgi:hypothetical protein